MVSGRMTPPRRRVAVLLAACAALALWAPAVPAETAATAATAATASPARIIATLNAQRKANGIPAGIRAVSIWNQRCKKHDIYMSRNDELTHFEEKGKPGYTSGGAWAGQHAVINYGSSWTDGNPFQEAPIHFAQLMQPRLKRSGAFEYAGSRTVWGCVITLAGQTRKDATTDTVYTYPGDGVTGVARDYHASEGPFTPNQIVGAPEHCGQELFVFASGPILTRGSSPNPYSFHIAAARLAPKGGSAVALKIADGRTRIPRKYGGGTLGGYLGVGTGIVIPVKPLKRDTLYVASVTIRGNGGTVKHTWSFRTQG